MAKPLAVDLSHHLSQLALRREQERLAGLFDPASPSPSLISLDGGVPAPSTFPFESVSIQYLAPDAFPIDPTRRPSSTFFGWLSTMFNHPKSLMKVTKVTRFALDPTKEFDIAQALSYSPFRGLVPLRKYVREFVAKIHQPSYADWDVIVDLGAGDALPKVLAVLAEPGDICLVDAYTYNQSLLQIRSVGIKPFGIQMDGGGINPADLERVLTTWDVKEMGSPRPRLLLQVPVGQNPTGSTLTPERKRIIYEICAKWDIIIIEDDPYHFLQSGPYIRPDARMNAYAAEVTDQDWLASLAGSFIRYDYEGRVIRLDTFSKVIGPGSRLGILTAPKCLIQHLENAQTGTSTAPSGLSQALIGTVLMQWGIDGFVRWQRGLRGIYRMRRDWVLDLLFEKFDIQEEFGNDGHLTYVGYAKGVTSPVRTKSSMVEYQGKEYGKVKPTQLLRFTPPAGGMFLWLEFDLSQHPEFASIAARPGNTLASARNILSHRLFTALVEHDVLLRPGHVFQVVPDDERDARGETTAYMRLAFSTVEYPQLQMAITNFVRAVSDFFCK
ncbi:PLP-dependent transferase [Clavulina sp. PMI_390]|nr:PLP-dependent transferase [Clavulina sp. PMI_390]